MFKDYLNIQVNFKTFDFKTSRDFELTATMALIIWSVR